MARVVSPNIRVRYPDHLDIGEDSIVDDYSYFSTRIKVGKGSHLAAGVTIGGGIDHRFVLGDYSTICSGSRIYVSSNDFTKDIVTHNVKGTINGDVIFGDYTALGCNSMVMPDNVIPEGVAIGALSFVPSRFKFIPWMVYAGNPIRIVGPRNYESVMAEVHLLEEGVRS